MEKYKVQVGCAAELDFSGIDTRTNYGWSFADYVKIANGILPEHIENDWGHINIDESKRNFARRAAWEIAFAMAKELTREQYDWYSNREFSAYATQLMIQLKLL